jgi:hypothetical protein
MSDLITVTAELSQKRLAVHAQMGRLASDWALLELLVNDCIWNLADVAPTLGACITAQIFTINNRFLALVSLMRLRQFPEEFVKDINKFSGRVRDAGDRRNRVIHDPVFVSPELGEVGRLEVTAQRQPIFEIKTISEETLLADCAIVYGCVQDFFRYREKILAKLSTLPEIPKSKSLPIDLRLILHQQNPASGT